MSADRLRMAVAALEIGAVLGVLIGVWYVRRGPVDRRRAYRPRRRDRSKAFLLGKD